MEIEDKISVLRNLVSDYKQKDGIRSIPLSKDQIFAATDAIESVLNSAQFRQAVSGAIDGAISPESMTPAQKKRLFGRVIEQTFKGEIT